MLQGQSQHAVLTPLGKDLRQAFSHMQKHWHMLFLSRWPIG